MKKITILFAMILGFAATAQTIEYNDGTGFKQINDAEAQQRCILKTKSPALTLRVNNPIAFTTIVNDGKKESVVGIPGRIKSGTAIAGSFITVSQPSGSYVCGTPMAPSNFLTTKLKITSAGYYTVCTDLIDGVMFYATGYADTGDLSIKMQALGEPHKVNAAASFKVNFGGLSHPVPAISFSGAPVALGAAAAPTITVNGNYVEGTELNDTANSLSIDVTVSTDGEYCYSTPVTNGIFFFGAGKFGGTGLKKIIMKGYGTPSAASTDNFMFLAVNSPVTAIAASPDSYTYVIEKEVYKIKFGVPGSASSYNIEITGRKTNKPKNNVLVDADKAISAYEAFIYDYYGANNLKMTPYGILMNKGITDVLYPNDVNVMNTVHIFLDEKGNSLLTTIPQGLPDIQYVVHVIYSPANEGDEIAYGIMDFSTHKGGVRIENDGAVVDNLQSTKSLNGMKEYSIMLKTADSNIDFTVVRYENDTPVDTYKYKINMTDFYTANMSIGLLNTQLKDPTFTLLADPSETTLKIAKREEGGNRGYATIFATLYTSPITLFKHYRDKRKLKKGNKDLTDINNPVADFQLYSKDYLYMRPFWERIYPTVGVGITDKVFQNLFFGLNWEFARGGSFFVGGHYGRVNVFNAPDDFVFESTNLSTEQFDVYKNKDWAVDWAVGISLDFKIIENLFK